MDKEVQTQFKCIKCWLEKEVERPSEYVYHGFTLCADHFKAWHKAVLEEKKGSESKIITMGGK